VPAITVIVDAGWSKCAHKHSYNALSFVGAIFGKETKKLVFIGVRKKYCTVLCVQRIQPENMNGLKIGLAHRHQWSLM